jgi:hypothetical protein
VIIQAEFSQPILANIKHRNEDARIAVALMERVDGLMPLLKGFEDYVASAGKSQEFLTGGNPKLFVYGCWRMHAEWTDVVSKVFYGDLAFVEALDRVCFDMMVIGRHS